VVAETDAAGRVTRFEYDARGRQTAVVHPDGTRTESAYDLAGRMTARTNEGGHSQRFAYDAAGRLVAETSPLGAVARFEYDANGNRVAITDRNGNTTRQRFDARGQRIATEYPDGTTVTYGYDAFGRQVSVTNQAGGTTRFEYDVAGNVVATTDALGHRSTFAYDALDNRVRETDPLGNVTTFAYDRLRRLTGRVLPLGQSETRRYDAAGNLVELADFNGRTLALEYDAADRLIERVLPDGEVQRFEYTPTGRLAAMTDATGRTTIDYDLRDRPTRLRQPGGAEIGYAYDPAGNRAGVTTPAGAVLYDYDADDRLVQVEDTQGGRVTLGYDATGNLTAADYPGGLATRVTYDPLNRPLTVTHNRGGTLLASWSHLYGPAGNRVRTTDHTGRQVDYGYDALFQLTSEQRSGGGLPAESVAYSYDAAGNRLSRTDGAGMVAYAYDANNRLVGAGGSTFSYDGQGNLVSRNGAGSVTSYAYDGLDRLVRVQSPGRDARFGHDALGNRTSQQDGTARTEYLVDPFGATGLPVVLAETDAAGNALADYVYAGSRLLAMLGAASGTSYLLDDGTRSTRLLADPTGTVTDRYDYDAFGELTARTGSTPNAYLYRGQELDAADGLYNLRARRYDPQAGRFLGRDPVAGDPFLPLSSNPYLYASNDPVNRLDPSGRWGLSDVSTAVVVANVLAGIAVGGFSGYVTYQVTDGNKTMTAGAIGLGFALGYFKLGGVVYKFIPLAPAAVAKAKEAERAAQALQRQLTRIGDLATAARQSAPQGFRVLKSIKTEFVDDAADVVNRALQNLTLNLSGDKVCNLLKYAESLLATGTMVVASASDIALAREIVAYLRGTGGTVASDLTGC
jgi:RHS repeat-associated protein